MIRVFEIEVDGSAKLFHPNCYHKLSQDLLLAFHDTTQLFLRNPDAIKIPELMLYSKISRPYVTPNYRVVDLEILDDWQHSELLNQATNLINDQFDESSNSR